MAVVKVLKALRDVIPLPHKEIALSLVFLLCLTDLSRSQDFDSIRNEQYNAVDQFLLLKRKRIDSLHQQMIFANDSVKVNCLNQLYDENLVFSVPDALNYLEQAGNLARKIGYIKGVGLYQENMGRFNMEMKNLPLAEEYLQLAMDTYLKNNYTAQYINALQSLGYCYFWQMKYDEALKIYKDVLNYRNKFPNDPQIAFTYRIIGKVLDAQGRYEEAFEYFKRDMEISRNIKDIKGSRNSYSINSNFYLGNMYMDAGDRKTAMLYFRISAEKALKNLMPDQYDHQMGEIHFMLNNCDSAMYYYLLEQSCISRIVKDSALLNMILVIKNVSIAKTYLCNENFSAAIPLLEKSLLFCNCALTKPDSYNYLAKIYERTGDLQKSLFYSRQLMNLALKSGARPFVKEAAEMHWKIFDRLKLPDSVSKYLKMYLEVSQALSTDKQLRNIAAAQMKAADEKHLSELQSLNKEKLIAAKQKQILVISLIALAIITFFIVWQIILIRRQNRRNRVHLENELKLQKLEKHKAVAEFEKKVVELEMQALRAQMNPHFIFNSLNSINSFILKNNSSEASRYLSKFSKLIRMILQHSQSSMIPLQDELAALHLYIQLEQLRFSNHFEYSISVPEDLDSAAFLVPPLFIQPYVENAIWHGLMPKKAPGRIDIEFILNESFVVCKISDDGIGRKKGTEIKQTAGNTYKSSGMRITLDRMCLINKNENRSENGNPTVSVVDSILHDGSAGGTIIYIKIPRNDD